VNRSTPAVNGDALDRLPFPSPAHQVEEVMGLLDGISVPGALNIYREDECTAAGEPPGEATRRRDALRRYLRSHWSAGTILVGEAPGKDGARWTGLPFTSVRLLTGTGPAERTATVMQSVLAEMRCESDVLLWNVSALFPPGNRSPRSEEIEACAPVLARLCAGRQVLAIGRHAEKATCAPYIRHPSFGGAVSFREGLRAALASRTVTLGSSPGGTTR
jgi:uracil-DNA glycosylase